MRSFFLPSATSALISALFLVGTGGWVVLAVAYMPYGDTHRLYASLDNASLLASRSEGAFGSHVRFNSTGKKIQFLNVFTHRGEQNGFGLGYLYNDQYKRHSLYAGFGVERGSVSLGTNAALFAHSSVGSRVGFSSTLRLTPGQTLTVLARNIMATDTVFDPFHRELGLGYRYGSPRAGVYGNAEGVFVVGRRVDGANGFRFVFEIEKVLLHNPALHLAAGIRTDSIPSHRSGTEVFGGSGFTLRAAASRLSLFVGSAYALQRSTLSLSVSVALVPLYYRDRIPPYVNLTLSDTVLTLRGETTRRTIAFGLDCRDNENGSGIAAWTLVIAVLPDRQSRAIRLFGGSGAAPSTIVWDGRGSDGELVAPGTYYVLLTALDREGNRSSSGWQSVRVQ